MKPGPVSMDIALTTGPNRNWANLWKPVIDSFGPVVGEDPARSFHRTMTASPASACATEPGSVSATTSSSMPGDPCVTARGHLRAE